MSRHVKRRWINLVIIAAMLISLAPTGLLAQAPAPNPGTAAKSAAEYYAQNGGSPAAASDYTAKAADQERVSAPGVTPAQAQAKIHPDLRETARTAAPALPARDGIQAAAAQEPILVQVVMRIPATPTAKDVTSDLAAYFVDGKFYARPAVGKGEFKVQMVFGQVYPHNVAKLAYLAAVDAILPLTIEKDGQPMDMPIDDVTAASAPGPDQ